MPAVYRYQSLRVCVVSIASCYDVCLGVYEDGVVCSSDLCPLSHYLRFDVFTTGLPNILSVWTVNPGVDFFYPEEVDTTTHRNVGNC
jgi:hypothetical protein